MKLKIGNYEFVAMDGSIGGYGNLVEEKSRPGIDGHDFRKLGKRGHRFTQNTKSTFNSETEAHSAADDYADMFGEITNIEKNGYSVPKVIVLNVSTDIKKLGMATDGSTHMVFATWELQRMGE
jgi:hypothetical protein